MDALLVVLLIIYLVINSIIATYMRDVAIKKGYEKKANASWILCLFGGIGGWMYVMALPDLVERRIQEEILSCLKKNIEEMKDESRSTLEFDVRI